MRPGAVSGLLYDLACLEGRLRPEEHDKEDWDNTVDDLADRADCALGAFSPRFAAAGYLRAARRLLEHLR